MIGSVPKSLLLGCGASRMPARFAGRLNRCLVDFDSAVGLQCLRWGTFLNPDSIGGAKVHDLACCVTDVGSWL